MGRLKWPDGGRYNPRIAGRATAKVSEDQRPERRLMARFGESIEVFGLIEPGDEGARGMALAAAVGPGDGTR